MLIAALAFLAGCATAKEIQGPNGGKAYFIKCGSAVIDKCYEKAAEVCPKGYTFADRQNNPNSVIVPVGTGFMAAHGPNSMLVECKE
jgi:hypothetical protein